MSILTCTKPTRAVGCRVGRLEGELGDDQWSHQENYGQIVVVRRNTCRLYLACQVTCAIKLSVSESTEPPLIIAVDRRV